MTFREYVDALMATARPARWPTDKASMAAAERLTTADIVDMFPPDPDLMGSPEGDVKGLRELQEAARVEAAAAAERIASAVGEPCTSEGCTAAAVTAVRFHGPAGHVHACGPHTADLCELPDIAEIVPVARCPWTHGVTWTGKSRDLA